MRLLTLAGKFLRIGATGFGGAMALIGLMQQELVEKSRAVSAEDFGNGVALGQILPGPVAVDCATYIGYRLRGTIGAVVTTCCLILPAFALMLVLAPLYLTYGKVPAVAGFFKGIGPAVVAVILAAAWRLGKRFVPDLRAGAIAVVALVCALLKANPILLILVAGLLGILIRGRAAEGGGQAGTGGATGGGAP